MRASLCKVMWKRTSEEDARRESAIRGILFDFDGTLADTYALIMDSFRYAVSKVIGHEVDEGPFAASIGIPLTAQMDLYTDDPHTHAELLRVYRAFNESRVGDYIACFAGMSEVLAALSSAGWPLGIVTSRRRVSAEAFLRLCGIEAYFPHMVCFDDGYAAKPDPEPVIAGARQLRLGAEECLYIGDSPFDMRAGNAAEALTVAVGWGVSPVDALLRERPDFFCEKPGDILELPLLASRPPAGIVDGGLVSDRNR